MERMTLFIIKNKILQHNFKMSNVDIKTVKTLLKGKKGNLNKSTFLNSKTSFHESVHPLRINL